MGFIKMIKSMYIRIKSYTKHKQHENKQTNHSICTRNCEFALLAYLSISVGRWLSSVRRERERESVYGVRCTTYVQFVSNSVDVKDQMLMNSCFLIVITASWCYAREKKNTRNTSRRIIAQCFWLNERDLMLDRFLLSSSIDLFTLQIYYWITFCTSQMNSRCM